MDLPTLFWVAVMAVAVYLGWTRPYGRGGSQQIVNVNYGKQKIIVNGAQLPTPQPEPLSTEERLRLDAEHQHQAALRGEPYGTFGRFPPAVK